MTQEQKDLLAQRRWTEFLMSLDANSYYKVPLPDFYDKGIINAVAGNINNSKRKPKEFDIYDPPPDFGVYVHVRRASLEKIRASRESKPTFGAMKTDLVRRHKWAKLIRLMGPGRHPIHCKTTHELLLFQKKLWDMNSNRRLPYRYSTEIDYKKKRMYVTVIPLQEAEDAEP